MGLSSMSSSQVRSSQLAELGTVPKGLFQAIHLRKGYESSRLNRSAFETVWLSLAFTLSVSFTCVSESCRYHIHPLLLFLLSLLSLLTRSLCLTQLLWFHASGSVYSGTVEASYEKQQRVVCGRGGEGPQEMTGSLTPILTLIYVLFYISLCKLKKKKKNHSCLCCSQNRSGYGKPTSQKKTTLLFSDLINKRPQKA